MFERFTEAARQVVVLAQEEARLLAHMHIGTEHLLLGVIRQEDEVALPVLEAHGLSLETARAAVTEAFPPGDDRLRGQIPFTPGAKKVL
ncbi:MAG TPA: Clp protease N-terminal domain-containing protein, partial [Thermoleophilaceae bacterium]|nr:Clp protease N-terminal domain-containing protein [Thermoleophilaceae bacterium]